MKTRQPTIHLNPKTLKQTIQQLLHGLLHGPVQQLRQQPMQQPLTHQENKKEWTITKSPELYKPKPRPLTQKTSQQAQRTAACRSAAGCKHTAIRDPQTSWHA